MSEKQLIEENVGANLRFYTDSTKPNEIIIESVHAYGGIVFTSVLKQDYESYKRQEHSALDLLFKSTEGHWPPTEEEKRESERQWTLSDPSPTYLIDEPESREVLTEEDLKKMIPLAEKAYIDWKGKLPDDYVSPLTDKE